jgi:uncharacterized protein YrrD
VKQVEQVEQAEQRESLDRGVIGGVSIANGRIAVFTRFTTFQRAEKRVKIQKNIILTEFYVSQDLVSYLRSPMGF